MEVYMIRKQIRISQLLALSFLITACVGPWSTKNVYKGTLTKDQLHEIAALIDETEMNPTSERSEELRQTLSLWLVESPDIIVRIYNTLELSDEYKYKPLFTTQAMLLSAKYVIRNPEMKKEHFAIQLQTLEGLLDMYAKLVSTEGDPAKDSKLDALVQKRADGLLEAHVQAIITEVGDG